MTPYRQWSWGRIRSRPGPASAACTQPVSTQRQSCRECGNASWGLLTRRSPILGTAVRRNAVRLLSFSGVWRESMKPGTRPGFGLLLLRRRRRVEADRRRAGDRTGLRRGMHVQHDLALEVQRAIDLCVRPDDHARNARLANADERI